MWTLAAREFRALFAVPSGWLLLAVSQLVAAWWFLVLVERYQDRQQAQVMAAGSPLGVTDLVVAPYLGGAPLLAMVVMLVAVLGLRLLVHDRRQGTLVLLLASPLGAAALVLGKYLAVLGFAWLALGLWCLMPAILVPVAGADPGVLLAGALGLALALAALLALALLVSCLTDQPAAAAALSAGLTLILMLVGREGDGVLGTVGMVPHLRGFLTGWVSLADLTYFGALAAGALVAATLRVHEWRAAR